MQLAPSHVKKGIKTVAGTLEKGILTTQYALFSCTNQDVEKYFY
jgi:hypothetical protein